MKKILVILLLLSSTLFSKTIITIVHPFQEYFIKKIAEEKVYIKTVNEESREFDISDEKLIDSLAFSEYYFTLNLLEEKTYLDRFLSINKQLIIKDNTRNIEKLIDEDGKENPYFWLDPLLVRDYVTNIYNTLCEIRSYDKEFFTLNYEKVLDDIDSVYLQILKKINDSNLYGFVSFNNKFDYFAKRFKIKVIHKENRVLSLNEVSSFLKFYKDENIRHFVIEEESDYTIAQSYATQIDGKIIEVNIYERNWKMNLFTLLRRLVFL